MSLSLKIKTLSSSILYQTGIVSRKIEKQNKNKYVILMYHRILPRKEAEGILEAGMYVDPHTFEKHIIYLKNKFYLLPLEDLVAKSIVKSHNNQKPICVLTFDDGWDDFYTHAFPILKKQGVPATIFLPTALIGTEKSLWTDQLADIFHGGIKVNSGTIRPTNPLVEEIEAFMENNNRYLDKAINLLKTRREEEIWEIINELRKRWRIGNEKKKRSFLTWEEVREMGRSGIVNFGSHTANHRILTTLTTEEIKEELLESLETLKKKGDVNPNFFPFSYPNGNYTPEIAAMVREEGYSMAVTTENGWNAFDDNLFELKRISLHQDISSTDAMFACRLAEIF